MNGLNIIAIDLEFAMLNRFDVVLVSGAMSNISVKSRTLKLQGNPIVIQKNPSLNYLLKKDQHKTLINNILRIFKNNNDKTMPIINELELSVCKKYSSLTQTKILSYLYHKNNTPVIITWNGDMDNTILNQLGIKCGIYTITGYDNHNNGYYYLKIYNIKNKKIILAETELGHFNKKGRLLSLSEAHSMICKTDHNSTYLHDPVTDVRLTKCLYHFLNNKTQIDFNLE